MDLVSKEVIISSWVVVVLYAITVIFLVMRAATKIQSISDYATGSIVFSPSMVGLSLAASMTSAATFIINPGWIALYGLSAFIAFAVTLPIAAYLSLIILTKAFRKYGTTVKAATMAQWIGKRYNSPTYSLFFAFLSLLLITFIVLICVGLTQVLSVNLGVSKFWTLVGIIVFIFGYMMFGGANSMVYTNTIQALVMIVVAFILIFSGSNLFAELGISGFFEKLGSIDPNLQNPTNPKSPMFRDWFEIAFCQVVVGVAIICQPHIITRSLLLKEDSQVNRYLTVGIIVQTIFFLVVVAGMYARMMFPDLTIDGRPLKMDEIITIYVAKKFDWWVSLVVVLGLIFAGISTIEGLIQSLSITITSDILGHLFKNQLSGDSEQSAKRQIFINRIVIVFLAIAAIFVSWTQIVSPNLSVSVLALNGVYAYLSAAFVPVLFGIFLKNVPTVAPFSASVIAILTHVYIYYTGNFPFLTSYFLDGNGNMLPVRNPAIASSMGILLSLCIGLILYFIFKNKNEEQNV